MAERLAHVAPVAVPSIPFGPDGVPAIVADATYYREAARNIRWNAERGRAWCGSNVTEAVARLCEAAASSLEAAVRAADVHGVPIDLVVRPEPGGSSLPSSAPSQELPPVARSRKRVRGQGPLGPIVTRSIPPWRLFDGDSALRSAQVRAARGAMLHADFNARNIAGWPHWPADAEPGGTDHG